MERPKRLLPPVYLLCALLLMAGLHVLFPVARVFPGSFLAGGAVAVMGVVLILWAARLFNKAGTAIKPFEEATKLVVAGPYRWSRNPMYLGMVIILLGIGVALGTVTPLAVLPIFVWLIRKQFIACEETMLEKVFGSAYAEYKGRIRRWI